ncbi:hypothetical protein OEZ86_007643 [Tetradesmus obliquus]|nr:hypothetical protein OEZ86_007643 [Tetradesmus obliquus]
MLRSSNKPISSASAAQKRGLREFKKRLAGYSSCGEVIWDELFSGLLEQQVTAPRGYLQQQLSLPQERLFLTPGTNGAR